MTFQSPDSRRQHVRRQVLGLTLAILAAPTALRAQEWQRVEPVRLWIGDDPVAPHDLQIDLPLVAEDGSSVNLGIAIPPLANDPVRSLAIFAPGNPTPEVASFEFTDSTNPVRLTTRIRLSESQSVVVVARTASNKVLVSERAVRVTTSGCVAPAGGVEVAQEMQARVRLPRQIKAGANGEILTLITHPMHTGLAQDASGETPALRIVETFEADLNGRPLLKARFYRSLAANPYLRFYVAPEKGGELTLTWTETGGRQTVEHANLAVS